MAHIHCVCGANIWEFWTCHNMITSLYKFAFVFSPNRRRKCAVRNSINIMQLNNDNYSSWLDLFHVLPCGKPATQSSESHTVALISLLLAHFERECGWWCDSWLYQSRLSKIWEHSKKNPLLNLAAKRTKNTWNISFDLWVSSRVSSFLFLEIE